MALSAGTRLGPYEILAPLGAGGMGEVYRARDPRLKREVALKVLPPEVASDPERLERFEREAQTLAALNHPHIVTIFSVEEADDERVEITSPHSDPNCGKCGSLVLYVNLLKYSEDRIPKPFPRTFSDLLLL